MLTDTFHRCASHAARWVGSPWLFAGSVLAMSGWVGVGVLLGWRERVHLWPTAILTWITWFACVLIQHSQVSQEAAMQRKLDEIIHALAAADNRLIGIEKRPETEGQ